MRKVTSVRYWMLAIFFYSTLLLSSCKKDTEPTPPDEETPELSEVAKAKTGVILTPKEDYEKITLYVPKTFAGGRTTETTAADLTNLMPPIGDQGQQGSCNAFAVTYAIKSYLDHIEKKNSYTNGDGTINYSSIASPAYIYNQINNGQDRGSRPERAFRLMQTEGVCSWQEMPYNWRDFRSQPSAQQKASAAANKLFGWGRTVISTENFKTCIQEGLPIYIISNTLGLKATGPASPMIWNSYDESSSIWEGGYHAMVITGFDDNIKAFKVMNSWGTFWGNQGFSWLSYDLVKNRIFESYIAFSKSMEPKITEYDERQTNTDEGTWTRMKDPAGYELLRSISFTIVDTLYFIGRPINPSTGVITGNFELLAFQPKINAWVSKGESPQDIESGGFVINSKAYLMMNPSSTYSGPKKVMEYNPTHNRWTTKKDFINDIINGSAYRRARAAMFSYSNKGYYGLNALLISGSTAKDAKVGELWEYDPNNDSWLLKTQLPTSWCNGPALGYGMIGTKLLVAQDEAVNARYSGEQSPFYQFDFNSNTWLEKGTITPRMTSCVSGILNGKFFVGLGGFRVLGKGRNDVLYGLDSPTQKWNGQKPIPIPANFSAYTSTVWSNRMYIIAEKANTQIDEYQLWEFKP